ncbi:MULTISPECIES: membrane protein [Bacillus cereus group]|uniref:Group-specific protein n=1 Tax=Bacillus cereus TaxID=1396 RepID=A0AA44TFH3_BACCE|nr:MULTISPECIES: membrane protein [Bacillus cereus group]PFA22448.1 hypothetical protein CN373_10400 [Bacillus cereus]PFN05762.1 hypothetical protein COJ55_17380 [Bacillus cereus]PFR20033.1 hypothetical protein COK19_23710 [Bacillus cereus]PFS03693.1 hypothetical protein COK38_07730 [Bacillus cereus]PGZ12380.1 hypothetical protein COE46_24095 [Bacillus cereus]
MELFYRFVIILYTVIIVTYTFPDIFTLRYMKPMYIALFIFCIFVIDCCISFWIYRKKREQNEQEKKRTKRKKTFWMMTYVFVFPIVLSFVSERIAEKGFDLKLGATIFFYYFFFHFIPYMSEKTEEDEDPFEKDIQEQEDKMIEEEMEQLAKRKWYFNSTLIFILCLVTPPIGYVYVFLLRKKMTYYAKMSYLTLATITMGLWAMKFLPPHLYAIVIVIIACLVFMGKYIR